MPDRTNPEQRVIDEIDQLVNESLARPITDDYNNPWQARCELCHGEWHGLAGEYNECPGAYATDEEREQYLENRTRAWSNIAAVGALNDGYTPQYPRYQTAMCPLVRFWAQRPDGSIVEMRGRFAVTSIEHTQHTVTYTGTINGYDMTQYSPPIAQPPAVPEGFVDIGYITDAEINTDYDVPQRTTHTRTYDVPMVTTTCTVTQQLTHDAQATINTLINHVATQPHSLSDRAQYAGAYAYQEHFTPTQGTYTLNRCTQCEAHMPRGAWVGEPGTPRGLCHECYTMQRNAMQRTQAIIITWQGTRQC